FGVQPERKVVAPGADIFRNSATRQNMGPGVTDRAGTSDIASTLAAAGMEIEEGLVHRENDEWVDASRDDHYDSVFEKFGGPKSQVAQEHLKRYGETNVNSG